jgi:carbon-monoxide dehydrogenase large subunit
LIGESVRRREDARVLRGETRYVDDISLAGTVHVAFVRSPYAHARVLEIRGPRGLLTAEDLPLGAFPVMAPAGAEVFGEPHPILARDEVRYAGQPLAAVVADSRAEAEDCVEQVEVAYEELALDASPLDTMRFERVTGDAEGAFAAAAHVVVGEYALPRLAAVPIECRGAVASYDADADLLTVWCSAQDTHRPLAQLSSILGRPASSIRVIVPDVGGAFGSKGVIAPEVAVVAAAAIRLGRPVKWAEDRIENLVGAYQGRGIEGSLELALAADGRMLALRARLRADLGAYLLTTTPVPPHTAAMLITGCYDIPCVDVSAVGVRTYRVPTGPYRGAGRPDAAYMIESLVDDAARAVGVDRIELRRRNLIRSFPHRTAMGFEYDSGDYERCLSVALGLVDDVVPPADPDLVVGRGAALFVERAGGQVESAEAVVEDDGRVVIRSSSSPHGQGHDTVFAQIASSRLGLPLDRVELQFGDSASAPAGTGTFGSRSVAVAGSAVALVCEKLIVDGILRPGSRALVRFESPLVFSSGAYAAVVAVSQSTGRLRVLRLAAVDDSGNLINPLLAHGQVLGGVVQGLGECLSEEVVYDEDGQLRNASLMDYSLLTAAEIPPIVTGEVATPTPHNVLGAKGVGEGGAIGSLAAVSNAVVDALGGRHVDPPFTDEKLWRALRS